jgi:hypothetical protein
MSEALERIEKKINRILQLLEPEEKKNQISFRIGGSSPFGFRLEENKLVIDEKEIIIARKIFDLRHRRKFSIKDIARTLNRDGDKTKREARWHCTTVSNTLKNELLISFLNESTEKKRQDPDD